MSVKINCVVSEGACKPIYKTKGAAGADVCAFIPDDVVISPGEYKLIPTGLFFEIPECYEIQVRPRSGLAFNYGVTVLNTPGTIDSDYRGELKVILINHGKNDFVIHNEDRIAQIVVAPAIQADFDVIEMSEISATERGQNGFGSTGIKK